MLIDVESDQKNYSTMFYSLIDCIATGTIIGVSGHIIFSEKWLPVIPAVFMGVFGAAFTSLATILFGASQAISTLIIGTVAFLIMVHVLCNRRLMVYTGLVLQKKAKSIAKSWK